MKIERMEEQVLVKLSLGEFEIVRRALDGFVGRRDQWVPAGELAIQTAKFARDELGGEQSTSS